MTAQILQDRLNIGGISFLEPPSEAEMRTLFGEVRSERIPLDGGNCRTRHVCDQFGVVFLRDDTPPEIPTVFFAFCPEDTPGHPANAYQGELLLGDIPVGHDATEGQLPSIDSLPLRSEFPHCWYFASSWFSLHLQFARRRNVLGKRSGIHRFAYASVSFHRHETA